MRPALLIAAVLALIPARARANCVDPSWCVCHARGTTVFEVTRGELQPDGGAVFDVVATFGAAPENPPEHLQLQETDIERALVADADPERVVPLDATGHAACARTMFHDATVLAMLSSLEECRKIVVPDWDGQCHDVGFSCSAGVGGPALLALAGLALVLRRRAHRMVTAAPSRFRRPRWWPRIS